MSRPYTSMEIQLPSTECIEPWYDIVTSVGPSKTISIRENPRFSKIKIDKIDLHDTCFEKTEKIDRHDPCHEETVKTEQQDQYFEKTEKIETHEPCSEKTEKTEKIDIHKPRFTKIEKINRQCKRPRVLKYGPRVHPSEAYNMLLARSLEPNIAVPEVHNVGQDRCTGDWYIEMSHIDGMSLEDVYDTLTIEERGCVVAQLTKFIQIMRTRAAKAILAADGMPSHDQMLQEYQAVYRSETAFRHHIVDGFLDRVGEDSVFGNTDPEVDEIAEKLRCLKVEYLKGEDSGRFVFSHGNLTPRNILIQPRKMEQGGPTVIGILDWSQAGFYPLYWEYVKAHCCEQVEIKFDDKSVWEPMEPGFLRDRVPDRLFMEFQGRFSPAARLFKKAYRKVWGYGNDE